MRKISRFEYTLVPIWGLLSDFMTIKASLKLAALCSNIRTQVYAVPIDLVLNRDQALTSIQPNRIITSLVIGSAYFNLSVLPYPTRLLYLRIVATEHNLVDITSLTQCRNLITLWLEGVTVSSLEVLTTLPNLTSATLDYTWAEQTLILKNCPSLTQLAVTTNAIISPNWVDDCPKLFSLFIKSLEFRAGPTCRNCPQLKRIHFDCSNMQVFHCPPQVEDLHIETGYHLTELTGCVGLIKVTILKSNITNFNFLANSPNLTWVKLDCYKNITIPQLAKCTYLDFCGPICSDLSAFPTLTKLKLKSIDALPGRPPQLRSLTIRYARFALPYFMDSAIFQPSLTSLKVNRPIDTPESLELCPNLQTFHATTATHCLPHLRGCSGLETLVLGDSTYPTLAGLEASYKLTSLTLTDSKLATLDVLYSLVNIRVIDLTSARRLRDIEALGTLPWVETIILKDCVQITSVACLSNCPSLTCLDLGWCYGLTDFDNLKCPSLRELTLGYSNITNINCLKHSPLLTELDIEHSTGVIDIAPLSTLSSLYHLNISGTRVVDLTPLSQCGDLQQVILNETKVMCLAPLLECPLTFLFVERCQYLTDLADFIANAPADLSEIKYHTNLPLPPRIKNTGSIDPNCLPSMEL